MFFDLDIEPQKPRLLRLVSALVLVPVAIVFLTFQAAFAQGEGAGAVPVSDPVSAPVALPALCAEAGVSSEECLELLGRFSLDLYCDINAVGDAECPEFIADYVLPRDCRAAELTVLGCIDWLSGLTRKYREQVKGLIDTCKADPVTICASGEVKLKGRIAVLEAQLAQAADENADLKGEINSLTAARADLDAQVDRLTQDAQKLAAELDKAQSALEDKQLSVGDVCRAAADRLNARAQQVLAAAAPTLDQSACAANPIAEITRFLAELSAGAGRAIADPAQAKLTPDPDVTLTCAVIPTTKDLVDFMKSEPVVFDVLPPEQFTKLTKELAEGKQAQDTVNAIWPDPLEDADFGLPFLAIDLLCTRFPATCLEDSGLELCQ